MFMYSYFYVCSLLYIVSIVLFYVLFVYCTVMCCTTVLLPPGVNPFAVNKYIISYHIIYHTISISSATPLILSLDGRRRCVQYHMAVGLPRIWTKQKAEFIPDLVWTFWRRKFSLATARIRTPGGPSRSLVAIPLMSSAVLNWPFGSGLGDRCI